MIKRSLAVGLVALAFNAHAHAAPAVDLADRGNAPAGAIDRTAVDGPPSPHTSFLEAASKATGTAEGRVDKAPLVAPSVTESLAYVLMGLGVCIGLLARRRR